MDEPGEPITVTLRQGPGSLGRPRMKILFDDDPQPQNPVGSRSISASNSAMLLASGLHEKSVGAGYFRPSILANPRPVATESVAELFWALYGPVGPSMMTSALCFGQQLSIRSVLAQAVGAELLCSRNRRSSTGKGSTRVKFLSAAT